jgi:anti-sigma factor RsiW
MSGQKLKKLFDAARNETAPAPSADFAAAVLRAVRREKTIPSAGTFSIFDQLNLLFPRLALAATAVIVLGVAADFGLTAAGVPNLSDGVSQISAQWFLTPEGF